MYVWHWLASASQVAEQALTGWYERRFLNVFRGVGLAGEQVLYARGGDGSEIRDEGSVPSAREPGAARFPFLNFEWEAEADVELRLCILIGCVFSGRFPEGSQGRRMNEKNEGEC